MNTMEPTFDFSATAAVFVGGGRIGRRVSMTYRRFATTAEAVRFAIELQSSKKLPLTVVETDEGRLGGAEIRSLYESADYPLPRGEPL